MPRNPENCNRNESRTVLLEHDSAVMLTDSYSWFSSTCSAEPGGLSDDEDKRDLFQPFRNGVSWSGNKIVNARGPLTTGCALAESHLTRRLFAGCRGAAT
jgi:hypothetical protein